MIKLSQTGVGAVSNTGTIQDSHGSGTLPIQAHGDGVTSFKVNGRVSPEAPWIELQAAGTADFIQGVARVPYIQLQVLTGVGTVTLYIGDN